MSDWIVIDGDIVIFNPTFGAATVTVAPGSISGTGSKIEILGNPVCVVGDEGSVSVSGCAYSTSVFTVSGVGTCTIRSLNANQQAIKVKSEGTKMILKGSDFIAEFSVDTPAQTPPSASTPDPVSTYFGTGHFTTVNNKVKGT